MAAPRPSVSHDVFLDAALKIADAFGPDALTTRSLGTALGLDSTTVYRYFGSKDVLLGSLYDHVIGQVIAECANLDGPPEERIRALITSYRGVLYRHPNVARLNAQMADMLFSGQGKAPNVTKVSAILLATLMDLGLTGRPLMLAYQFAETFIVGAVLYESGAQSRDMSVRAIRYEAMAAAAGIPAFDEQQINELSDESFALGVDRLLDTILDIANANA